MAINRENYEIWFIDYLDGNLDKSSTEQLYAFLENNPDLAEELQMLENVNLEASAEVFEQKEKLLKPDTALTDIPEVDYLLIKRMEEGLTRDEEMSLAGYFDANPALIISVGEYQKTRLIADETVHFPMKTSLLKRSLRPVLPAWSGIAAAFLLFLGYQGYHLIYNSQEPVSSDVQLSYMVPRHSAIIPVEDIQAEHLTLKPVKPSGIVSEPNVFTEDAIYEPKEEPAEKVLPSAFEPTLLASKGIDDLKLHVTSPNAYETGLRHMMPLYLDINNSRKRLLAEETSQNRRGVRENGILVRGLQFVDKVSGELISFDKVYDEQGNYVAFNLKTMNLEIEQKVRR